jgi:Rrf2 family transcriptional regulator, cysteine metabolism repressor
MWRPSERLPGDYVEQILLRLRRAGIVQSTRGAKGGYALARPAADITVREIIAAAELVTFDLHCETHPLDSERCAQSCDCSIRPVWMMLQKRIDEVLDSVRLADLLSGGAGRPAEGRAARPAGLSAAPMPLPFTMAWRSERERQRRAAAVVAVLRSGARVHGCHVACRRRREW